MHSDPLSFSWVETIKHAVVQCDECIQHSAGRIEFQRQSSFSEVNLHACRVSFETLADVAFCFANKIFQERVPRIPIDAILRIKQAQG